MPKWNGRPVTDYFRHVHRRMLNQTGERTLVNAILPQDVTHLDTVYSICFDTNDRLVQFSGLCSFPSL